ncbi:hypothetical protein BGW36DRAFT_174966 [Talaromyces proteolyticus]|uniref:Uncharacterized protein n=1 Tax=Talaromyces proteolyticus TaxID=1131652 RepID=A0AAD4KVR2_9EURO|nr:uncharacterized protein BGW36DRAFT_174966 [Talaromyces proteolyticus]KAH8697776.1 hypothetical protein BGW36DRAFT_174966 [Talaromyces proteolyticus]
MVLRHMSRVSPASGRRRLRPLMLALMVVCGIYWLATSSKSSSPSSISSTSIRASANERLSAPNSRSAHDGQKLGIQVPVSAPRPSSRATTLRKDLVVASMKGDNTSWLYDSLPDWNKNVYVVDDEDAELTVVKNKGRESMVYLSYIIDNYDHLPEYMLFIHSQRYQWHNDDPYYDGVPMINRFQTPYLELAGYVNLRCAWVLGCPEEIHPLTDSDLDVVHAGPYYMNGFKELFPGVKVPDAVGVSCCAQFGVAKWKILERPKKDYQRYKKWLLETELDDATSGRIMEYSWHSECRFLYFTISTNINTVSVIFGMDPIHCPDARACYCNVWGLCNLDCSQEECEDRYMLPPFSNLPEGWPYIGWDGEPQDPTERDVPQSVFYD